MSKLILTLLFVLPFIVNPFGGAYYEFPKVLVAEIAIELILVYCLFRAKFQWKNPTFLILLALFILSVIDLIFFQSSTVLFGNSFRLQGTFLLWHLLIWAFVVSHFQFKLPKLVSILPLLALFLATFFIATQSNGRNVATLGEPNALAATAIFFWPFAWIGTSHLTIRGQKLSWVVRFLSLLAVLAIIFVSGSRSGLIAISIEGLFLLCLSYFKNWKLAISLALLVFLLSLILPGLNQSDGYKFEDRTEVWRVAAAAGLKSPLIGQGFGNVEEAIKKTSQDLSSDIQYQYVDSSHNIFLDFWIEGGAIGLGLFIALITFSFRNFIKEKKILETTLLLGLITALSFNPASATSLVALWWVLGQGLNSKES